MTETKTTQAKYVFLDIVGFTLDRCVEDQSEIIDALNKIVIEALKANELVASSHILSPTGDGICIGLLDLLEPYDVHLQLALSILKGVHKHNEHAEHYTQRFKVRIGLNENLDNRITDINGNPNVAGAGINLAQRVMSVADGNQILVGVRVYETLRYWRRYVSAFRYYPANVKHGLEMSVYQFIQEDHEGLNCEVPSKLVEPKQEKPRLTYEAAYYMAHALKNKEILRARFAGKPFPWQAVLLLWFRAKNSYEARKLTEFREMHYETMGAPNATFEEQLDLYDKVNFHVRHELGSLISATSLLKYSYCFHGTLMEAYLFVSPEGVEQLKREAPFVWAEIGLDESV